RLILEVADREVRGRSLHVPLAVIDVGSGVVPKRAQAHPVADALSEYRATVDVVAGLIVKDADSARQRLAVQIVGPAAVARALSHAHVVLGALRRGKIDDLVFRDVLVVAGSVHEVADSTRLAATLNLGEPSIDILPR